MPRTVTDSVVALLPKKASEERPMHLRRMHTGPGVAPGTRCMTAGWPNTGPFPRGTERLKGSHR